MNVREIMTSPVITTQSEATIEEAAKLIIDHGVSCLPVLDEKRNIVGILTHTDFGFHRRYLPMTDHLYTLMGSWVDPDTLEDVARAVSNKIVKDVMTKPAVTIQENASISEIADLMLREEISRIPVMKGNDIVGIVTRHDFVKLMLADSD